jgi:hypothetical protein
MSVRSQARSLGDWCSVLVGSGNGFGGCGTRAWPMTSTLSVTGLGWGWLGIVIGLCVIAANLDSSTEDYQCKSLAVASFAEFVIGLDEPVKAAIVFANRSHLEISSQP